MALFRWLSLLLIVVALMLLGADVVSTLESPAGVVVRSLDKVLLLAGVDGKIWVQARFAPAIANALLAILASPGWAVIGIVGVVLALITPGRRERHRAEETPHQPIER